MGPGPRRDDETSQNVATSRNAETGRDLEAGRHVEMARELETGSRRSAPVEADARTMDMDISDIPTKNVNPSLPGGREGQGSEGVVVRG
jgi:hypothetical protein